MENLDINLNRVYACYLGDIKEINNNDEFTYLSGVSKDKDVEKVHTELKNILTKGKMNEEESEVFDDSLVYSEAPIYSFMNSYNDERIQKKDDIRTLRKLVHFINPITLEHVVLEQTKKADISNYYKIYAATKDTDIVASKNEALILSRHIFWKSLQNTTGVSKTTIRVFDNQEFADYINKQILSNSIWIYLNIEPRKLSFLETMEKRRSRHI